ncbi:GPCR, family 2-like [Lasallia pustulata]|uniref:GPCR, family 2-like n=1 Tax=Lasallia pustulata TaxID=136370 RepID=A0A1W5CTY9_9LECA|nr:GPCR, family 2-like [Lasallia pustulata]
MADSSLSTNICPAPFLAQSGFASTGGFIRGRLCAPVPTLKGTINCCLPCPMTEWVYPDNFSQMARVANWLNVLGLVCTMALLISFVVLPADKSRRHYLTVCLVVGVTMMQVAFIIPLGAKPDQCHNAITPNDMYSDLSCAFTGAFLLAGGFSATMWVFMRSLSLHLQICWEVVPGRKFFYGALLAGWGLPIVFVATSLAITGVSYRFGDTCHINHNAALGEFWGPLLAVAGAATVIQVATFGYCIRVYIKSLLSDDTTTDNSSGLPSYNGSVRTVTAKQAYRRVWRVIELQWRSIALVLILIADTVFFAVIFVSIDNTAQATMHDIQKAEPWLLCLVVNGGNKNACLDKMNGMAVGEATVMGVLILLSINGIWCFLFLGQWTMIPAWYSLLRRPFVGPPDFVSVDARRLSAKPRSYTGLHLNRNQTFDPRTYEMLPSPPKPTFSPTVQEPNTQFTFGREAGAPSSSPPTANIEYFGREAEYSSPSYSFSNPRPPTTSGGGQAQGQGQRIVWDPRTTHARGSTTSTTAANFPRREIDGFGKI